MKIGIISQWYPPEQGSAALPGTICEALANAGHEIAVVTGFPNYPQGVLQKGWRQKWGHCEHRNGVTVYRTPLYVSHDHRSWRRMLNYGSFALSATVTSLHRLRSADVVWVHGTPVLPALAAMALRRLSGTHYVLHIQDLWPDTVLASGMLPRPLEPLFRRPIEWFCKRSYERASAVAIITPGMRETLVARGVPNEKIVDIPNWADESIFHPMQNSAVDRSNLRLPNGFLAMYAGAMGDVQGLETLINAANLLRNEPHIHIALVGDGVAKQRLSEMTERLRLTNVTFVPSQPLSAMSQVIANAEIQVVCLKDLPLYRITLPSKIQATMAAGRPLIVSAGGDAGAIVEKAQAGLACQPGDPEALAEALRHAYKATDGERSSWGANGRKYYEENLSQSVGVTRMIASLKEAHQNSQDGP